MLEGIPRPNIQHPEQRRWPRRIQPSFNLDLSFTMGNVPDGSLRYSDLPIRHRGKQGYSPML